MADYRTYWPTDLVKDGVKYNAVLDVSLEPVEDPLEEPVTLDEVKAHGVIEHAAHDDILTAFITAARELLEGVMNVSFVKRNATVTLNNSLGGIYLPYGPVGTVAAMEDADENPITSANYELRGEQFKYLHEPVTDYVKLVYEAGYEDLPGILKTALLSQVIWMYENRETGVESVGPIAKTLIAPFKRNTI